jgi:predicted homoserine dehydrogenase-like protein
MCAVQNNLMRCTLGAIGVGVVEKMSAAIHDGVTFSVLAAIVAASTGLVVLEWTHGPKWRRERMERLARKLEEMEKGKCGEP